MKKKFLVGLLALVASSTWAMTGLWEVKIINKNINAVSAKIMGKNNQDRWDPSNAWSNSDIVNQIAVINGNGGEKQLYTSQTIPGNGEGFNNKWMEFYIDNNNTKTIIRLTDKYSIKGDGAVIRTSSVYLRTTNFPATTTILKTNVIDTGPTFPNGVEDAYKSKLTLTIIFSDNDKVEANFNTY